MTITTVLFDLDGVIRHFDPGHVAAVEEAHGLTPGSLIAAAFSPALLEPAITGQVTRAEWTAQVGDMVGSPRAAHEWMIERGHVDQEIVTIVARLRAQGMTVAILTNGTSTIADEMDELGLTERFDAIFNSADIGYAKPDRRVFQAVCDALDITPETVFFTDDSESKLAGAIELGMHTRHFTSVAQLRTDLTESGI